MPERGAERRGPPWWPSDRPFPPHGAGPWRRGRGFPKRIAVLAFIGFWAFVLSWVALAFAILSEAVGLRGSGLLLGTGLVAAILIVLLLVAVGRTYRRLALPLGDVMEGAERVASGDYRARVQPRGWRDVRRLGISFNAMTERLESNEARRRELLSDIAHELRTPLSVIRGNIEGMRDGLYPADDTQLARVLDETAVMSHLLDDLQTLSTAEAGALRLHTEPVESAALVEDAVSAFRSRAGEKGVTLDARTAVGLPEIEADPVRIGQVLSNLLSNAVRHTPRGGSVVVAAAPAGGGGVLFEVSDDGPGIAAADLPHVFDRFVKAADSGGAGLGLAIAKSLVDAHGGQISAASEPGRGTSIRVTLPAGGRHPSVPANRVTYTRGERSTTGELGQPG
jgi:signal transduction histidine kinase